MWLQTNIQLSLLDRRLYSTRWGSYCPWAFVLGILKLAWIHDGKYCCIVYMESYFATGWGQRGFRQEVLLHVWDLKVASSFVLFLSSGKTWCRYWCDLRCACAEAILMWHPATATPLGQTTCKYFSFQLKLSRRWTLIQTSHNFNVQFFYI